MAHLQTSNDGAEGSDALKDFLFQNKKKFKDVQDIYNKLVQNGVDYSSLMISSQEDLRDILVYMKVNPIDRMKLINILKSTEESHVYKELNTTSPSSSVIVLSSIQNDFLLNFTKTYEIASGNVHKVQNSILDLAKTTKDIQQKIDKQYTELIKTLQNRKSVNLRKMNELCEDKRTKLKTQLSLAKTARETIKILQNDITQCLNSNRLQFAEKQNKINQIIENAQLKLKSLEPFCDTEMNIDVSTKVHYECDSQLFVTFVSNDLDLVCDTDLRFLQQPEYNNDNRTVSFKVECRDKTLIGAAFAVDLCVKMDNMDDDEKKESNEMKIKIGTFELPKHKNDIVTMKVGDSIDGLCQLRVYNDSMECLSKQWVKIPGRMQWSNDDKDDYTTISNNGLTITNKYHGENNHLIRTDSGYSDGIHCYQITLGQYSSDGGGYPFIGFASKKAERVIGYSHKTKGFWGFYLWHNHTVETVPDPFNGTFSKHSDKAISKQGGVMILKLDMRKREITLYYDGVKTATISNMQWSDNETLYPALYLGCIRHCKFTAEFNQDRIDPFT